MSRLPIAIALFLLVLVSAADARPQVDWDQPLNLSLRDADLGEVLTSFAKIGGATLDAESLDGEVTVEIRETPFSEALDRVCRHHALRCVWLEDSARLRVRPASESGFRGLATAISLDLKEAPLDQVLEAFERVTDDRVAIDGEFTGTITISLAEIGWPEALERLCAAGRCAVDWSGDPILVTPGPGDAPTSRHPGSTSVRDPAGPDVFGAAPSNAGPRLRVRFAPPDADAIEAVLAFDWSHPVRHLAAGDHRLHLAWIPFDGSPPLVLPIVERCGDGAIEAIDPVPLGSDAPIARRWKDAEIEIASTLETADGSSDATPCSAPVARLAVRVRAAGEDGADDEGAESTLLATPGSYLMIEAPRGARAGSPLAVARIASEPSRQRVAFVRPATESRSARVREVAIEPGTPQVERFDGWAIELSAE